MMIEGAPSEPVVVLVYVNWEVPIDPNVLTDDGVGVALEVTSAKWSVLPARYLLTAIRLHLK